ncbi:MAG: hypothetical protein AAGD38_06080 [Acidobacteriota bacterium]
MKRDHGPSVSQVSMGDADYDNLTAEEQAVIRDRWITQVETAIEQLRLDKKFAAEGRSFAELGEDGEVVVHHPVKENQAQQKPRLR